MAATLDQPDLSGAQCMNADDQAGRWTRAMATTPSLLEVASRAALLLRRACKATSTHHRHTRTKCEQVRAVLGSPLVNEFPPQS